MFPDLTRDDVFRLETRRLWLRWPRHADVQAIHRLAGDREVAEMTAAIPHPYPPDGATTFVFESRKANALGRALQLAVTPKKKPNQLIGMVGILPPTDEDVAPFLGYWIGRPHWGRGYATEAAAALLRWAFDTLDLHRVHAAHLGRNPQSGAVLRKVGMRHEGRLRSHFPKWGVMEDLDLYGLLAGELPPRAG